MSMLNDYATMILYRERADRLQAEAKATRLRRLARVARKRRAGPAGHPERANWVRAA